MAREIDMQESQIIRQLIRDPRTSDNEISRRTGISLRTVNRKRKKLEKDRLLSYYAHLNNYLDGTGQFHVRCLVRIRLKHGITRKAIESILESSHDMLTFNSKHVLTSYIGEEDGHNVLVVILESRSHDDIVEILNAETIPLIHRAFGTDSVVSTSVTKLTKSIRVMRNYLPELNIASGKIKDSWDDSYIYVT